MGGEEGGESDCPSLFSSPFPARRFYRSSGEEAEMGLLRSNELGGGGGGKGHMAHDTRHEEAMSLPCKPDMNLFLPVKGLSGFLCCGSVIA